MTKQISGSTRRRPLYRRRKFWGVMLVLGLIAGGVAAYIYNQSPYIEGAKDAARQELKIDTEPDKATIYLDGRELDKKSDVTLKVTEGKHKVKVQLAGYDEHEAEIEIFNSAQGFFHRFTQAGQVAVPSGDSYKTYTNKTYGYSIQVPSDYEVQEEGNITNFNDPSQPGGDHAFKLKLIERAQATGEELAVLTIMVLPNPNNLGPEAWYKAREEYAVEDQGQIPQKNVTVNGQAGYQYESPYGFTPTLATVVTGKGNAFLLTQIKGSPYRNLYEKLISTFKLL